MLQPFVLWWVVKLSAAVDTVCPPPCFQGGAFAQLDKGTEQLSAAIVRGAQREAALQQQAPPPLRVLYVDTNVPTPDKVRSPPSGQLGSLPVTYP